MDIKDKIKEIEERSGVQFRNVSEHNDRELYLDTGRDDFLKTCLALHKELGSPVRIFFAEDDPVNGKFRLYCGFESAAPAKWVFVRIELPKENPVCPSLSKEIFSASLFEREIFEMFGIEPVGSPTQGGSNFTTRSGPRGFIH